MTGEEIKRFRKSKGLTQEQLAKIIGVSKRTILNYEKGEMIPKTKINILKEIIYKSSDSEIKNAASTSDISEIEIIKAIDYLLKNNDVFMKNQVFRTYIKSRAMQIKTDEEIKAKIDEKMDQLRSVTQDKDH